MNTNELNEFYVGLKAAWARISAREAAFAQYDLCYEDDGTVATITDARVPEDADGFVKVVAEMPSILGDLLGDKLRTYAKPTPEDVRLFRASLGLTA